MAAAEAMQMSTTIGMVEGLLETEACAAVTEQIARDSRAGSPLRGVCWGLALSSVMWALLILGGREVWALLLR